MQDQAVQPLAVTAADLEGWSERRPMAMRLAQFWSVYAPRARGAVPRWLGQRFGSGWRTTILTAAGATLAVDPGNLDIYTTILREGSWEPQIVEACLCAVRSGDTFVDVGANAGYMTLEVARQRPDARIAAFEPQPQLALLTAVSARLSGFSHVDVYELAIGAEDGAIKLFVPPHAVHASVARAGEDCKQLLCQQRTIDTLLATNTIPSPDVMKIDVEGAEWAVLRGAEQTIREAQPVMIFEATDHARRFDYSRHDLLTWLATRGPYTFFSVGAHDVLAVPAPRVDEFRPRFARLADPDSVA